MFAVSEFVCLNTRLARPYSFALLFTLLSAYFFTKLLLDKKQANRWWILYAFCLAACAYTHYFSLLQAVIIYASGFLFLNKENRKRYLLSGFLALLLFVPHFYITKHQLGLGGLGGWLPKPTWSFLFDFLLMAFNSSNWIFRGVFIASIASFLYYRAWQNLTRYHILATLWFVLPFIIGFAYSLLRSPVLQDRVLLFAWPFGCLLLFSFFNDEKKWLSHLAISTLLIGLTFHSIFKRNFFHREYYPPFLEIAQEIFQYQKEIGTLQRATIAMQLNNPQYLKFYLHQDFHYLVGDVNNQAKLQAVLDTCTSRFFILGYSNVGFDWNLASRVQEKFPHILYQSEHLVAATILYVRSDSACAKASLKTP